jgi:hypothetical protein
MATAEPLPPGERPEDERHGVDVLAAIDEAFKRRLANPPLRERFLDFDVTAERIENVVTGVITFRCLGVLGSITYGMSLRTFLKMRRVFNNVKV